MYIAWAPSSGGCAAEEGGAPGATTPGDAEDARRSIGRKLGALYTLEGQLASREEFEARKERIRAEKTQIRAARRARRSALWAEFAATQGRPVFGERGVRVELCWDELKHRVLKGPLKDALGGEDEARTVDEAA
jgi:hypothetical protein